MTVCHVASAIVPDSNQICCLGFTPEVVKFKFGVCQPNVTPALHKFLRNGL